MGDKLVKTDRDRSTSLVWDWMANLSELAVARCMNSTSACSAWCSNSTLTSVVAGRMSLPLTGVVARPTNSIHIGTRGLGNGALLYFFKGVRKQYKLEAGGRVNKRDVWRIHPVYYHHVYDTIIGKQLGAKPVADE